MRSKQCSNCFVTQDLSEFYVHPAMADGHLNKCKTCVKARVTKHRHKNLEYVQEYDRKRGGLSHRKRAQADYQQTESGRKKGNTAKKAYSNRNPEKRAAVWAANNAVRDGHLIKEPCEVCGSEKVQGHHDDYSKPLVVRWLCPRHHSDHHNKLREIERAKTAR